MSMHSYRADLLALDPQNWAATMTFACLHIMLNNASLSVKGWTLQNLSVWFHICQIPLIWVALTWVAYILKLDSFLYKLQRFNFYILLQLKTFLQNYKTEFIDYGALSQSLLIKLNRLKICLLYWFVNFGALFYLSFVDSWNKNDFVSVFIFLFVEYIVLARKDYARSNSKSSSVAYKSELILAVFPFSSNHPDSWEVFSELLVFEKIEKYFIWLTIINKFWSHLRFHQIGFVQKLFRIIYLLIWSVVLRWLSIICFLLGLLRIFIS